MDPTIVYLLEKMKEHQPYSINSVISAVCACFSAYLEIDFDEEEKITSATLEAKVVNAISEKNYPRPLSEAFVILCKSIANDDLLSTLLTAVNKEIGKQNLQSVLEMLIQTEFLQQLGLGIETPAPLNELCLAILQPIDGTFYDGTAGIGSTAIEAYLYSQRHNGKLDIYTQEINSLCYAVSVIRAFLYGIDSHFMYCGDTLTAPQTMLNDTTLLEFDYSIMFPPMGLSWKNIVNEINADSYGRFLLDLPPTSSADWLFIQQQFTSLNENGKGIIALPSGALFNAVTSKLRETAIRAGIIECIITLPPNMLPYTSIPLSLMIISGTKKAHAQILMIQADQLFAGNQPIRWKDSLRLDTNIIDQICELYKQKKQVSGISTLIDINTIGKNDWILLPSRYIRIEMVETEHGGVIVEYPTGDDWLSLKNAGSFYRGINVSPSAKASENGAYKIINYADVQNGEVKLDNLNRYELAKKVNVQNYLARPGDLLISCKGTAIKICVVPIHTELVLLSINFIGIHIDQTKFNPLFIKYYLESPAGQVFLRGKQVGTSITTLTTRDLEQIPMPQLPLHEQNQYIQDLIDTEEKIHAEIERLYTQSIQAKWSFYQNIGLGKIMKKGELKDGN